jgi:hypothetical protein
VTSVRVYAVAHWGRGVRGCEVHKRRIPVEASINADCLRLYSLDSANSRLSPQLSGFVSFPLMTNLSYFHPFGSKSGLLREGLRIEVSEAFHIIIFYDFRHLAWAWSFLTLLQKIISSRMLHSDTDENSTFFVLLELPTSSAKVSRDSSSP